MIYAHNQSKEKIEATPEAEGFCPSCGEKLVPKCGQLKIWHWSHKGQRDCDDWYEPETEWHLGWKKLFGKENCEVVMPPHRADIYGNFNVVIELQHSSISPEEISKREEFYKKMIWIIDAHPFAENLRFFKNRHKRVEEDGRVLWSSGGGTWWGDEFMLLWKRRQKRWFVDGGAQMPVMLDLSNSDVNVSFGSVYSKVKDWLTEPHETIKDSLFWIKSLYESGIGGKFVLKQRILERYKPAP
jgi:ribosomal protein L37AE/L43A